MLWESLRVPVQHPRLVDSGIHGRDDYRYRISTCTSGESEVGNGRQRYSTAEYLIPVHRYRHDAIGNIDHIVMSTGSCELSNRVVGTGLRYLRLPLT